MLKYVFIIFCVAHCEGQFSSLWGDPADTRIIHGYKVLTTGGDKHQASLLITYGIPGVLTLTFQCAGTIIDEYHILTACHCVKFQLMISMEIRIGSIYSDHGGQTYEVLYAVCHDEYSILTNDNDIAIIKVKTKITFDGIYIDKAILPSANCIAPQAGDIIHVCGWGLTDTYNSTSGRTNQLNCVELIVVALSKCREQYAAINKTLTENMFCAYHPDGKDSCQGDSGSGTIDYNNVTQVTDEYHRILNGIVSWGEGCANQKFPGVYTVVCNYVCWIKLTIKIPLSVLEKICCEKLGFKIPELPKNLLGLP